MDGSEEMETQGNNGTGKGDSKAVESPVNYTRANSTGDNDPGLLYDGDNSADAYLGFTYLLDCKNVASMGK